MTACFGPFTLDTDQRLLTHDVGGTLHLTPKAFDLLAILVAEAPRVVRKAELHAWLWPGTFVSDATLVSLVKEIRRALHDLEASVRYVRTAHGVGYAFAVSVERVAARRSAVSRWVVIGARRTRLIEGENVIGRDPLSAIVLDMAGVSRRHARVIVGESDAVLEDLGSKNGTKRNDEPVAGRVTLRDGDAIHLGPVLIIYHASDAGVSTETAFVNPAPRK